MKRFRRALVILGVVLAVGALPLSQAGADTAERKTYVVVFDGDYAVDGTYAVESTYAVLCNYAVTGTYAVGGNYAVGCDYAVTDTYAVYAVAHQYAVSLVQGAGGTVAGDMLEDLGLMVVHSSNELFDETMRSYAVVEDAAEDFKWKGVPTAEDYAVQNSQCPDPPPDPTDPDAVLCAIPSEDIIEEFQWDMQQICVIESVSNPAYAERCGAGAHGVVPFGKGRPQVDVGILDTGIDGEEFTGHVDLWENVDCERGRDSIAETQDLLVLGPGVGVFGFPCIDNGFHGTHVAGTVAAVDNTIGMVGVAPDVRLIPVKVCDSTGYCYASAVTDGIYYAGHQKFDVINMSFFVDDNNFQQSTEYKCMDDPVQRTFRRAVERAMQFARNQGVTPVAALGNSDDDLAHPPEPYENNCDVVPAETSGVIGTMALGSSSQKAGYSNYGFGMTDVAAPGGAGNTGDCRNTVLSTIPGDLYLCIQGTSMASPHTAGVAALIVSRFGTDTTDTNDPNTPLDDTAPAIDVNMPPQKVENYLQSTVNDIGLPGYDECFGNGRIDALRAVLHETSRLYDATAPFCPEYNE